MKILAIILFLIFSNVSYCQDTIKVVMLYSDTSLTELAGIDEDGNEYTELGYDYNTYWKVGFIVLGWYYSDDYFLDADKKPIPKTNVIWNYKTTK